MSSRPPRRGRRGLRLLIALGLATAAAGGVYLYAGSLQQEVAQQRQQPPPDVSAAAPTVAARVQVVVARANVPARTPLTPAMFEVRDMPAEIMLSNAVTSLDAVAGKALDAPLAAGDQFAAGRLVDIKAADIKTLADLIPAGQRAISLNFTEESGAAGLIVPGNNVDVLAVFTKDTLGKDESMIMIQDVLVLAVAQNTSADQLPLASAEASPTPVVAPPLPLPGATPKPVGAPASQRLPVAPPKTRTVTLAVSPEAAERLALAEEHGHLRYIIRPGGERSQNTVLPADLGTLASPIQPVAAQIVASEISPSNVKVGDTLTIKITVKNTSDKPLQTMGPQPGFTYVQGQTYYSQQFISQPGKWRVAIGTAGLDSTELPYRWGLGGDLAPGASTEITGQIKLTSDFIPTNFWAAIVEEPAHVLQNGVGTTLVTSMQENVAVVAVDAANLRSGPSIASSVVGQVLYGTELEIVGQSADWFKVKLPDQREAWVAAGWIVTAGR